MAKLAINGGSKAVPEGLQTLWPGIYDEDRKAVLDCVNSQILTGPYGPQIRGAEKEFGKFIGVKHCLMVNAGTAALHLAVASAGLGPGDEAIVPSFTFLATALGVLHHNAVPVFVDIDPETYCIDPAKIEAKITPRTKAILPVHIHGLCADMDAINAIAKKHNLVVIEDAAQAHGAEYKGRKAGTLGNAAIFSVQASKNLGCGEGGFFVTNDDKLANIANQIRLFGQNASFEDEKFIDLRWPIDRFRGFESIFMGWQYMPGELPAALTRSQLLRLVERNDNARRNGQFMSKNLAGYKGLKPQTIPEHCVTVYHKYRLRLDPKAAGVDVAPKAFRDRVLAAIKAEGVEACLWETLPVPRQKNFLEQVGYGSHCPWACPLRDKPAPRHDLADSAVAQELLDTSIVLGSHSYPIIGQSMQLIEHYVAAVRKVMDNVAELF